MNLTSEPDPLHYVHATPYSEELSYFWTMTLQVLEPKVNDLRLQNGSTQREEKPAKLKLITIIVVQGDERGLNGSN